MQGLFIFFFFFNIYNSTIYNVSYFLSFFSSSSRLLDNTYTGTFGSQGYGAKANEVLSKVRGQDFKKEKDKRKGTYRGGGVIDTQTIRSVKLDDDDDE